MLTARKPVKAKLHDVEMSLRGILRGRTRYDRRVQALKVGRCLAPKRYQSGEKDVSGRISKIGDRGVRAAQFEAAHIILTRPVEAGALKRA